MITTTTTTTTTTTETADDDDDGGDVGGVAGWLAWWLTACYWLTCSVLINRNSCPPSPSVQSLLYKNDYDNTDDEEENDDDEVDDDDEDVDDRWSLDRLVGGLLGIS